MKRRVQKKKESKMLQKYEPVFENMFGSLLQLSEEFNPSEYRTQQAQIKNTLEKRLEDTQNSEQLGEAFLSFFATVDFKLLTNGLSKKLNEEIDEHIKLDERFGELFRLISDAEKKCPGISAVFFFNNNPLETHSKSLEPADLIQEFEKQKGERAGRTAVRIFREVAELVYDDYLNAIYGFVQILEGKKTIKLTNKFGNLTEQLPRRLEKLGYKNLVDSDAGWLRNATCHGRWIYKPEIGKTVLWDLNKMERALTPDELAGKAMDMYTMVLQNYLPLIMIYLSNQVCSKQWLGIIKYAQANLTSLVNGDVKKNEQVDKMIEATFSAVKAIEFKQRGQRN